LVTQQDADQEWAKLAEADADTRESEMATRYLQLAELSEDERRARLRSMAVAEYSLPDPKLREFTVSRMRTWINLDMDKAKVIADSYGAVMQNMPANVAMKRVALVQTLVTEFTPEEEEKLRELAPGVFAGAPNRKLGLDRPEVDLRVQANTKKPFWMFWK
jgi:hypothetical protein